jgi:rod shape-determining protein MreD
MNKRHFIVIGVVLALIEIYFANVVHINGSAPNITVVYLIMLALSKGNEDSLLASLFTGAVLDIFFYGNIGLITIFYVISTYIVGYNRHYFFSSNLNIVLTFVGVVSVAMEGYLLFSSFIFLNMPTIFNVYFFAGKVVYNLVIALLFFFISKLNWKKAIQ